MKIKGVDLGTGPRAAAVITGGVDTRVVKKALKAGADLIEVRVDTFEKRSPGDLTRAFERLTEATSGNVPLILTVRSQREGGKAKIPDAERLEIFNTLMPFADMVDIELSSGRILKNVLDSAKRARKKTIVSYHNFRSTPQTYRLREIVARARNSGADVVKIAARADNVAAMKRLAGLLVESKNLIVVGMGGFAAPSRVLFPYLGSLVTYGSVGEKTAPGQLDMKTLKDQFRLLGGG